MMSSVRTGGRGERRRRNGRDGGREEGRERESQIKKNKLLLYYNNTRSIPAQKLFSREGRGINSAKVVSKPRNIK